jgi:hypothetical protein
MSHELSRCRRQEAFEAWIGQGSVRLYDSADGFSPESCIGEYQVMTSFEANEACKAYIRENLWAFRIEFLEAHSDVITSRNAGAIHKMQEALCEDANEVVSALVRDFDALVEDAIASDGRGHFLSSYDGEEHEIAYNGETYYIYRVN